MDKLDDKKDLEATVLDNRLQNIIKSLSKCKIEFLKEREECKKIREANHKLEVELREVRELEKSHRYHLLMSREMIGNLQETVSQLVHLKRDVKKLKEQLSSKDSIVVDVEKEKETMLQKHNENVIKLRNAYEKQIEDLKENTKKEIQQVQHECDAQVAQFSCVIEELRAKMKEMDAENRDKINVVVLEYEEKIQRETAQVAQLQEQLTRHSARNDINIEAYRRRLEELEEKLKQSQFKQYLAQSTYPSQYESQVERPYSVTRDPYPDSCPIDLDPLPATPKPNYVPSQSHKPYTITPQPHKAQKPNTLQVMYYDNKAQKERAAEKKGLFQISKKRKLYNDKEFQDF